MESEPLPYDIWITDALRMVVRRSLDFAVREGLPGDHHFFITYRTEAPGVEIPGHLKAQYPEEITIVIQHQYWDLMVDDESFSVTLRFSGRETRLRVPFAAITAFADPSVKFGLQFKSYDSVAELEESAPVEAAKKAEPEPAEPPKSKKGEVITLESFRKKN